MKWTNQINNTYEKKIPLCKRRTLNPDGLKGESRTNTNSSWFKQKASKNQQSYHWISQSSTTNQNIKREALLITTYKEHPRSKRRTEPNLITWKKTQQDKTRKQRQQSRASKWNQWQTWWNQIASKQERHQETEKQRQLERLVSGPGETAVSKKKRVQKVKVSSGMAWGGEWSCSRRSICLSLTAAALLLVLFSWFWFWTMNWEADVKGDQ